MHGEAGDPYVLLGVPRDATADELRAAYERRLEASAKAGDLLGAQRVDSAYELLRHETRRAMFDRTGLASQPERPSPDDRFIAIQAVPFRSWSPSAVRRRRSRPREILRSLGVLSVVTLVVVAGWRAGLLPSSSSMPTDVWSIQPAAFGSPPTHLVSHPQRLLPRAAQPAGAGGFAAGGARYDPCQRIHYVVSGQAPFDGAAAILKQAITSTSLATGLRFQYDGISDEPPTDGRSPYQPKRYGNRWAPVLIAWTSAQAVPRLSGKVVGLGGSVATVRDGERWLVSGIVYLDAPDLTSMRQGPQGPAEVQAVVLHELGHVVGLRHVDDPRSIMNPQVSPLGLTYSPGDRRGLAFAGSGDCSHFR